MFLFTLQQTICFLRNTLGVSTHSVQTSNRTVTGHAWNAHPSVREREEEENKGMNKGREN